MVPGEQVTRVVLRVRVLRGGLGGGRRLGQLQVVLALLAHAVGVGAAGVPLHPGPAVLPQLPDDPAQAGGRPVLVTWAQGPGSEPMGRYPAT